jgi:hypothetical protein
MSPRPLSPAERAELLGRLRRLFGNWTAIVVDGEIVELSVEEYVAHLEQNGEAWKRLKFERRAPKTAKRYCRPGEFVLVNSRGGLRGAPPRAPLAFPNLTCARPRERRARRVASSSRSGGDPPDEADPEFLARLRGFSVANERLYRHVERRIGARRIA